MNRLWAYFAATLLAVALGGSGESCCGQGKEQGSTGKLASARGVALTFAAELWGQSEADGGTVYQDLEGDTTAVAFTIFLGQGVFPGTDQILASVRSHRQEREEARAHMVRAKGTGDSGLFSAAASSYLRACEQMLGQEIFATVVVANVGDTPRVAMAYRGLPLHYVAIDDAWELARRRCGTGLVTLSRLIYLGIFEIFAQFESEKGPLFADLLFRWDTPHPGCGAFSLHGGAEPGGLGGAREQGLPATPTGPLAKGCAIRYISGVPDYQTIYSRGCAPAASGCVLGYWDDHGYNLLIDGGPSTTEGHRDPNGYGYLHTIWDELGPAMEYVEGQGTPISNIPGGIVAVCNWPQYQNCYAFSSSNQSFSNPAADRQTHYQQVEAGRPCVYTMKHPLYGGGAGYHSVTGVGWMENGSARYRIVHDNNEATGTDVYLNEADIYSERTYTTRVIPGAAKRSLDEPVPVSCSLTVRPNPFRGLGTISYAGAGKGPAVVEIADRLGRSVRTWHVPEQQEGPQTVCWDGTDATGAPLPSGVYLCVVQTGRVQRGGKIVLVR